MLFGTLLCSPFLLTRVQPVIETPLSADKCKRQTMSWHARNTNASTPPLVPWAGWWSLTLIPALLACLSIPLQSQSSTAKLTVTVTVVPSAHMIFLPDGSTKVMVANSHESGSAANSNSQPENAPRKSMPANAPADSQGARRTRRRVKP